MRLGKTLLGLSSAVLTFSSAIGAVDVLSGTRGFFEYPYRLYLPTPAPTSSDPAPLIVFLQGVGSTFRIYPSDPSSPTEYNTSQVFATADLQPLVDAVAEGDTRAIVVVPHFIGRNHLGYNPGVEPTGYHQWAHEPERINLLVDYLRSTLPVDPQRVYITGLSAGATGTYMATALSPELYPASYFAGKQLYAAAAPLSARNASEEMGDSAEPNIAALSAGQMLTLAKVPQWIFHGRDDITIFAYEPRTMRNAIVSTANLNALGLFPRYTEITGMDHSGWFNIYEDEASHTGSYADESVVITPPAVRTLPEDTVTHNQTSSGFYTWLFDEVPANANAPALLPRPQAGKTILLDFGPPITALSPKVSPITQSTYTDASTLVWNDVGRSEDLDYAMGKTVPSYGGIAALSAPQIISDPLHSFGFVDSNGNPTRLGLRLLQPFVNVTTSGLETPGTFPVTAQKDSWWAGSMDSHEDAVLNPGKIRLENFAPGTLLRFTIFASRSMMIDEPSGLRWTTYTCEESLDSPTRNLDVAGNWSTDVIYDLVQATTSGTVDLTVAVRDEPGFTSSLFGYLGVLRVEVITAGPGSYSQWSYNNGFDTTFPIDVAPPGDDTDGDGIINLLEYALGYDPLVPGRILTPAEMNAEYGLGFDPAAPAGPTTVTVAYDAINEKLTLTYPRLASDVTYTVETSTLEAPVTWESASVNQNDATYTPGAPYVTASVSASAATRRFLRLRVELP